MVSMVRVNWERGIFKSDKILKLLFLVVLIYLGEK